MNRELEERLEQIARRSSIEPSERIAATAAILVARDLDRGGPRARHTWDDWVGDEGRLRQLLADTLNTLCGRNLAGIELPSGERAPCHEFDSGVTLRETPYTVIDEPPWLMREDEAPTGLGGTNEALLLLRIGERLHEHRVVPPVTLRTVLIKRERCDLYLVEATGALDIAGVTVALSMGSNPIRWHLPQYIEALAGWHAAAFLDLDARRAEVTRAVADALGRVRDELARSARRKGNGVGQPRLLGLRLNPVVSEKPRKWSGTFEFAMTDHALRDGRDEEEVILKDSRDAARLAVRRHAERSLRHRPPGIVAVDDMAAAVLRTMQDGGVGALHQLGTEPATVVPIPIDQHVTMAFRLQWEEGVIRASVVDSGPLFYCAGRVRLRGREIPDTIAASLAGRSLGRLVQPPLVGRLPRMASVGRDQSGIVATLNLQTLLMNAAGQVVGRVKPGYPESPALRW